MISTTISITNFNKKIKRIFFKTKEFKRAIQSFTVALVPGNDNLKVKVETDSVNVIKQQLYFSRAMVSCLYSVEEHEGLELTLTKHSVNEIKKQFQIKLDKYINKYLHVNKIANKESLNYFYNNSINICDDEQFNRVMNYNSEFLKKKVVESIRGMVKEFKPRAKIAHREFSKESNRCEITDSSEMDPIQTNLSMQITASSTGVVARPEEPTRGKYALLNRKQLEGIGSTHELSKKGDEIFKYFDDLKKKIIEKAGEKVWTEYIKNPGIVEGLFLLRFVKDCVKRNRDVFYFLQ